MAKERKTSDIGGEYTAALAKIVDLGSDGATYYKLCVLLQDMYDRSQAGDESAKTILDTLLPVSRLIDLASRS